MTVDYESPGGTPGEESFSADADVTNSPDNELNRLEQGETLGRAQEILSYVGGLAVIVVVLLAILAVVGGRGNDGGGGPDLNQ